MVKGKVINILQLKMNRLTRELRQMGPLPVSYLCVKYGADVFVELLTLGEITMDDSALVSVATGDSDG